MDLGRVALWSIVAVAGSGGVGYLFGFWEARPAIDILTIVGAVALAAAVVAGTMFARAFLRSRRLSFSLGRPTTNQRVGLFKSGIAIFVCINVGAFLGFNAGLQTAQTVAGVLSVVAVVVVLAAVVAMLFGIIYIRRTRHDGNKRR